VNESNTYNKNYFNSQFLIATPLLNGTCFEKSVIYICTHDKNGAMGLLINRSLGRLKSTDIFQQLNINGDSLMANNILVHFGGPVELSKGFVLHSCDYMNDNTVNIDNNISVTSDVKILNDLTLGSGPKNSIVAFGYAGWGAGQLEGEINSNSWLNIPATKDIIFNTNNEDKWQNAANLIGVDFKNYSSSYGHA